MTFRLSNKKIFSALAIVLAILAAFAFGFVSSLHLKSVASAERRNEYLREPGDAPLAVRAEVLASLRAFQDGYLKRDPKELDSFMHLLFRESDDVLLLGTDGDEWVRGYTAIGEFIRGDWRYWGDFRFDVEDSIVWSQGDVAWVASVGVVRNARSDRPVRFSAILTRNGKRWLFRQVHFQWDDHDPRPSDVFHPSTHLKLGRLVLQKLRKLALGPAENSVR